MRIRLCCLSLALVVTWIASIASAQPIRSLSVDTTSLEFGLTPVGTTVHKQIVLTNSSDSVIGLSGIIGGVQAPFVVDSGGGVFTLDSGLSRTVWISFISQSEGEWADSIVITSDADDSTNRIVVFLHGSAFIADTVVKISVVPQTIDYGIVYTGQSKPIPFTITNTTNVAINLSGNIVNAHPPFSVTVGLGNFSLDKGKSKTVLVQFAPDVPGLYKDSVVITTNAPAPFNRIVVKLLADVHSSDELKPQINLQSGTTDFGQITLNLNQTIQLPLNVKNISDSDRILTVKTIPPRNGSLFSLLGPDEIQLHKGNVVQYKFQFMPKVIGDFFDSVIFISDAPQSRIAVYLKAKVVGTGAVADSKAASEAIEVYPNPASKIIRITSNMPATESSVCRVSDATGRTVLVREVSVDRLGEGLVDISQLSDGIYYGTIESKNGKTYSFKMIVKQ